VHVIGGSAMAMLFPGDRETRFTTDIDAAVTPTRTAPRSSLPHREFLSIRPE